MTFIYHIAAAADWQRAVRDGQYTMSTRGLTLAEQGFIHAATAEQVALVANAFYRDVPDLLLVVIDAERVGPEIRYERVPGQVSPYPHIYGPLNLYPHIYGPLNLYPHIYGPLNLYPHIYGPLNLYPHIYGPLNLDAVLEVRPFGPGPGGQFFFDGEK